MLDGEAMGLLVCCASKTQGSRLQDDTYMIGPLLQRTLSMPKSGQTVLHQQAYPVFANSLRVIL
jgi:hypothetical protein